MLTDKEREAHAPKTSRSRDLLRALTSALEVTGSDGRRTRVPLDSPAPAAMGR